MKNVTLIKGTPSVLIGPSGERIEIFERFILKLIKGLMSLNTVKSYEYGAAEFIDYLIECECFLSATPVSASEFEKFVNLYPEFLARGVYSKNIEIRDIAERMGRRPVRNKTCSNRLAAANKLIAMNNKWDQQLKRMDELSSEGCQSGLENNSEYRVRGFYEREAISRNSVFGSNVNAHANMRGIESAAVRLKDSISSNSEFFGKDFPFELINPVLNRTSCARNRCLFAFLAASGLRISEALATQITLIDMKERTVRVTDPCNLRKSESYPPELRLPWKGRATAIVFLAEPLKSIFFESLEAYLAVRPLTNHNYLFVYHGDHKYGQPLYYGMSSSSIYGTLNEAFARSQSLTVRDYPGLECLKRYSLHSLRHFYGVYLSNYLWLDGRPEPGLLIEEVQVCMGHKDIKSTQIYARKKAEILAIKFSAIDQIYMEGNVDLNINEVVASGYDSLAKKLRAKPNEAPAWLTYRVYR